MTKYTSNEQYEKDKAKLIEAAKKCECVIPTIVGRYGLIYNVDFAAELLKQSKWIGTVNDNSIREAFKRHVYNAIFDAVNNHGVVADESVVQLYTNIASDDFFEEVQ